jgi:methylase of polypeptide subunit release factors
LGGSLFDPDRFPFLEGRAPKTKWRERPAVPLPIDNRTVLLLMTALQILEQKGGAQLLSYPALDVEQIGHVYEGLLEFTAARVPEITLGLIGTKKVPNPQITLSDLDSVATKGEETLLEHLKELTGRSVPALRKALKAEESRELLVRLVQASNGDENLARRLLPFGELIRADSWGNLLVYRQGSFAIVKGSDRRSSGTHYTPRSLTEPIVRYTLEPLVYVGPAEGHAQPEWKLKSSADILALKVCDMACGSGAFLVEACRYLSLRLVDAWANEEVQGLQIGIDGIAREMLGEHEPLPKHLDDRLLVARRLVAQSCLYGVDVNHLAVELAKLAIWLVTLAKNKPFSFLDHALRCGDSLVGLRDLEQLRFFSLKPDAEKPVLFKGPLNTAVDEAIELRLKLEGKPADTVDDVEAQGRLLAQAEDDVARLKCSADLLVAAEFWGESNADKQERTRNAAVKSAYYVDKGPTDEFQQVAAKERRGQKMFHWPLEFPEVIVKRGGFDAFVGNPPFITGTSISTILGVAYRDHVKSVWRHFEGRADICIAFLLRASSLIHSGGCVGIIGTDTVSEGDSRVSGPAFLLSQGFSIFRAIKRLKWPGTAAVKICHCHVYSGHWKSPCFLDGESVSSIDSAFDAAKQVAEPYPLQHSKARSFTGTKVYGNGFVLSISEATQILSQEARYSLVIKPYLVGRELNEAKCEPKRFIIDFTDIPEEIARSYPLAWEIIEQRVRPERMNAPERPMREKYWQFQRPRRELYTLLRSRGNAWLIAATSDTVAFVAVEYSEQHPVIFSHAVNVLALDGYGQFAAVQSSIHLSSTFALFGAFDEAYWSMERGRLGGILGGGTTTPDRRARRP